MQKKCTPSISQEFSHSKLAPKWLRGSQGPGTKPKDPGTKPRDLAIKPRALGTQHRAQGTKPSDPGTKPRDPGAKPRDYQSDLGILGQNLVIQGPNLGTHDGTKPSYCLYCSGSGFGGGRIILPVCSSIDPCCRLAVRP